MREQIDFAQSQPFRNFMSDLAGLGPASELVHGVFIDLHPTWKLIVDSERSSGILDIFPPRHDWFGVPSQIGPYDTDRRPSTWEEICERSKKRHDPFLVRVWVLPTTRKEWAVRRQIEDLASQQPFFAVLEDRPMAILATNVEGSNEITASVSGCLGGFLRDTNGFVWGVTCGHVAQSILGSVTLEDINTLRFVGAGTVRHTNYSTLSPTRLTVICNPYVGTAHADVDAALIELNGGFTGLDSVKALGTIDEIYDRTQLQSGSIVWMNGPQSGLSDYAIGGYGVTLKVALSTPRGEVFFCFSNLFEIYDARAAPGWMPGRVAQAIAKRPLKGDSGSWICYKKSQGFAYFGNLIAVEGTTGIATFADALRDWARNECNIDLRVL